jgi:hydroxyacylglutathione hydrolase
MAAAVAGGGMRVIPIPMHDDNYSYLVIDDASGACAVVDPAEHQKALDAAAAAGVEIRWDY